VTEGVEAGAPVAVALSGGVDSAAAAWLLMDRGFSVRPFHLILHPAAASPDAARSAADALDSHLEIIDLTEQFEQLVVRPFVRAYQAGRTPSPCVGCNPAVKFGLLGQIAARRGIPYLATGHYAARAPVGPAGRPAVVRPRDRAKDQTYFLSRLTPDQIQAALFPLADRTKDEVRGLAAGLGLAPPGESQDVCFLAGDDYRTFLSRRLGGRLAEPGDFVDSSGRVLGRHRGIWAYTVGQRRGLGLPGPEPYYVLGIDPEKNQVVIGVKAETRAGGVRVADCVWSVKPKADLFRARVMIRFRHRPAEAEVRVEPGRRAQVRFDQPQNSPAPGQAAAFYLGDVLIGGGWIEDVISDTPPPGPA
jgi:tRNA-specific 2-thiouridylase